MARHCFSLQKPCQRTIVGLSLHERYIGLLDPPSPAFVKWLTTPVTSPNGISAHLGRLAGIAEAEPEIREEIKQYMAALRSVPVAKER